MTTYRTLNEKTWAELLADETWRRYIPPVTAHLPIQPLHSPDLVHVDAALNVCRRRVFPNVQTRRPETYQAAKEHETFIVQFALDNPPFIPDFHLSRLELAEGKYPLASADYFAWDLHYRFDYCCRPLDDAQSLLWIRGTVANDGEKDQTAHVRAKVNFQRECDLFNYHYVPFYWDAGKWLACEAVGLHGDQIVKAGTVIGRVVGDGFSYGWETETRFADTDYNKKFGCGEPYFVTPALRLKAVHHAVHFQTPLRPGERRSFAMALLVNFEAALPAHQAILEQAAFEADRQAAINHFKRAAGPPCASLEFTSDRRDKVFTALQLSALQLLIRFPGREDLMPIQGGSSERFFVWVWEAVFMLRPLLRLGHFEPVRRALDFIFNLQDAGCPPEGKFTTTAGAVGTTGPRWMNSTGSALALAADYYLFSRDKAFLRAYLPKMERAAGWIVGELRATRTLSDEGTRPPTYGLMPFGCATDGDVGHIVAFTDSFTFWGLEKTVRLLETLGHARAGEFRDELEKYRRDIDAAVRFMTRPGGYIERKILAGEASVTSKFETSGSALQMAYTGNLDVTSPAFDRFVSYFETRLMDGLFTGRMDREVYYMGIGEYVWFQAYLRRGEWKKAFAALQINRRYGMTQDTCLVQERFSNRDPAFTPWQPNGSGSGRMLDLMLDAIWFEHDAMATLLGAVPFAWLRANERTVLKNLRTERGKIDIEVHRQTNRQCRVSIVADNAACLPRRLRVPEHFAVAWQTAGVVEQGPNLYTLPADVLALNLTVSDNESI